MHNVTKLLKLIDKNYPFIFPTYGYVLLTIGGSATIILIIEILYFAKATSGNLKPLSTK